MIRKKMAIAVGSLGALLAVCVPTSAWSQESPYCKKVRARASGDAALLFSPSAQVQGVKFPKNGAVDTSSSVGQSYQFRGVVTWSPLDFYKGFRVLDVAEADCREHEIVVTTEEVLKHGADYARLPALKAQREFLEGKRPFFTAARAKLDERTAAGVMTVMDAESHRAQLRELERKSEVTQGEIDRLEARGVARDIPLLSSLVSEVAVRALEHDQETSRVRKLDPWTVGVVGGIVPQYDPVDWFGVVQVGYNFGGISRVDNEHRYMDARSEELRTARYELGTRISRFREELRVTRAQTERELAVLERDAVALTTARNALAKSEATNAPLALDGMDMALIGIESERVYLTQFSAALRRMEER